MSFTVS